MSKDDVFSKAESDLKEIFNKIDDSCLKNSEIVLNAFHNNKVSVSDFEGTTGYGYGDVGRDKIDKVFAEVLKGESALVRGQFISGTHALTVALFSFLRPNDELLSICGKPYDTLDEVIGIRNNNSSLISYGIKYSQIELIENDFDYDRISNYLENNKVKVIEIQRSKGYSTRKSININKIQKVIELIKSISKDTIIMVDNCYCEFVEDKTPLEVGADIIVGSLIKNLGGGIAPNGAYIAGKSMLIEIAAERLTVPGQGIEVGPSLGINKQFLQGLYLAPSVVASSLKTAILTSYIMDKLGYKVEPGYKDNRVDIVQNIIFNDEQKLIKFCELIQKNSAIDSFSTPIPTDMPGYDSKVIMASGSFIQGSSIELSCDGPLREPFIAYMQGGITYQYGKIALKDIYDSFTDWK